MKLTFLQSGECLGILSYQFNGGVVKPYTIPLSAPDPTDVVVYVEPQAGCCVSHWVLNGLTVQKGGESYDAGSLSGVVTIEVVLVPCSRAETCTPRYKNYETLVAKANCMCSNIGVKVVPINELPGSPFAFLLYDKCLPELNDPMGVGYHNITLVFDPNYLLDTIECICGGRSDPEYIVNYIPPTPDKSEPIDPKK